MEITIIGVVGGTTGAGEDTLALASRIGKGIAESRCILLTGGEADENEKSVKAKAMYAAVKASRTDRPVGVIGIIPKKKYPPARIDGPGASEGYKLYLNTGVSSHERNVLTGGLPDVLIALPGETGTLSEIAYAVNAGKPVVFLNSWQVLRTSFEKQRASVEKIVGELNETKYQPDKLVKDLGSLFSGSVASVSYAVLNGFPPSEAVQIAVALGQANASTVHRYPNLEKSILKNLRPEFEEKLQELERRICP